jgi:hypothetical protein
MRQGHLSPWTDGAHFALYLEGAAMQLHRA